ncbi:MAG: hypothetical protein WC492_00410 [Candidatus Micrarchaeia archaeon]
MSSLLSFVDNTKTALLQLGPSVAVILIALGGITYGLSFLQPAQNRGKWQSLAAGMIIGGVIVAAITGAAELIASSSATLLT